MFKKVKTPLLIPKPYILKNKAVSWIGIIWCRSTSGSYSKFYTCWKIINFLLTFVFSSASFHCFIFLESVICIIILNILDKKYIRYIETLWKKVSVRTTLQQSSSFAIARVPDIGTVAINISSGSFSCLPPTVPDKNCLDKKIARIQHSKRIKSRKLFTGTGLLGKYFRSGTGPDTDEKVRENITKSSC